MGDIGRDFLKDIEGFGVSVGNTLDGLLTSDSEGESTLKEKQSNTKGNSTENKAGARPLMFYNPVFYYFNNNVEKKDIPKFKQAITPFKPTRKSKQTGAKDSLN